MGIVNTNLSLFHDGAVDRYFLSRNEKTYKCFGLKVYRFKNGYKVQCTCGSDYNAWSFDILVESKHNENGDIHITFQHRKRKRVRVELRSANGLLFCLVQGPKEKDVRMRYFIVDADECFQIVPKAIKYCMHSARFCDSLPTVLSTHEAMVQMSQDLLVLNDEMVELGGHLNSIVFEHPTMRNGRIYLSCKLRSVFDRMNIRL